MSNYFLRIEGVNLGNFVYDTNDLNTIRGGGWILLDAPGKVVPHLKNHLGPSFAIRSITQGASWGLVAFTAKDDDQAARVAACARHFLTTWKVYSGATFVVDFLPAGPDAAYPQVRERLSALNKWRQMQSPSLVVPQVVDVGKIPEIERKGGKQRITVCEFDHVSPACGQERKGTEQLAAGNSVALRRELGREKVAWYEKMGLKDFPALVQDFNELSDLKDPQDPLNHKMAVIYLDGNGFGALQRKHCQTSAQQQRFDRKLRTEFQEGTLKVLLNEILADPKDRSWRNNQALRFETLLWGGDEIIWVVPARKGWWLLAHFFKEVAEKWRFPTKDDHLTLAAGLVFCHCKAPIQRIVDLAKRLGDLAKGDRTANRVAYQVLESFDHAGADVDGFRLGRCPRGVLPHELLLDGNAMWPLLESGVLADLQQQLPKRRLHRLVEQLYLGEDPATLQKGLKKLTGSIDLGDRWQCVENCLGSETAQWLHLLELWDYLVEPVPSHPTTQEAGHDQS